MGFYIDLQNSVKNLIKIINSDQIDLVLKAEDSFVFKNLRVYFPDTIDLSEGQLLDVEYNRVDYFNLDSGSGTFYDNRVVFPSDSALSDSGILNKITSIVDSGSTVYFDYISLKEDIFSSQELSSFPIFGSGQSNILSSQSSGQIANSYQPIEYRFSLGVPSSVKRFSPCRLGLSLDSDFSNGLIRVSGSTITKLSVDIRGTYFDGSVFDLSAAIKEFIGKSFVPSNIRVSKVSKISLDGIEYDVIGYGVSDNIMDKFVSKNVSSLNRYSFQIPDTKKNNDISYSSGSIFCRFLY